MCHSVLLVGLNLLEALSVVNFTAIVLALLNLAKECSQHLFKLKKPIIHNLTGNSSQLTTFNIPTL